MPQASSDSRSSFIRVIESAKGDPADCRGEAGRVAPLVARGKCEGKAECEAICPYDVFDVQRIKALTLATG